MEQLLGCALFGFVDIETRKATRAHYKDDMDGGQRLVANFKICNCYMNMKPDCTRPTRWFLTCYFTRYKSPQEDMS